MDEEIIQRHILSVLPQLKESLQVSEPLLAQLEFVDRPTKDDISGQLTNRDRVDRLMAYIMQDVQSRFQPLINTLKKTKQLEPVQLLTSPEVAKLDDAEDSDDEQAQSGGPFSQPRTETASQSNAKKKEELVVRAKLDNVEPEMYGKLRCDSELLGYLAQEGVIRGRDRTKLAEMPSSMDRIQALLNHIHRDPIPRYEGFLRALVKSGQEHIVTDILQEPLSGDEDVDDEIMRDFNKALEDGEAETCRGRLVVLGRAGAGKTSVVKALLGMEFETHHIITDMLDIYSATIDENGTWERKEANEMREYEKNSLAAQVIKENREKGANKDSPTTATMHQDKGAITSSVRHEGSKHEASTDDHLREQAEGEPARQKIKEEKAPAELLRLLEEGKKDSMHIWDFAGQLLYYIVHQLFITATTIFLLVTDGSRDLEAVIPPEYAQDLELNLKTEKDYVEYFLKTSSIWGQSEGADSEAGPYGPPHAFVLVNKADLATPQEVEARVKRVNNLVEATLRGTKFVRDVFLFTSKPAAENEGHPEVTSCEESRTKLKDCIEKVKEDFIIKLPVKWLRLKNKLQETTHCSIEDGVKIAESFGIEKDKVKSVLQYFHQHRELVYWDTEGLDDFIICQPNWLINEMRKVITVKEGPMDETKMGFEVKDLQNALKNEGILKEKLAQELWGNNHHVMIEIMKKYLLLLPWTEDDGRPRYLVPCLLKPMKDTDHLTETQVIPPIYFYLQDGIIPIGLTTRLVTLLATKEGWRDGKDEPKIFFNGAIFTLKEEDIFVAISVEEISWKPSVGKKYEAKREEMKEQTVIQVKAGLTSENNEEEKEDRCLTRARTAIQDGIDYILSMINVSQPLVTAEECHCKCQLLPRTSTERENICNICRKTNGPDEFARWFCQELTTEEMDTLEMPDPMEINAPNNLQPEDEIIVAVLDTGIREDHPDFQDGETKEWSIIKEESRNFIKGMDADLRVDSDGHGTFVAGIIHHNADFVKILNFKVLHPEQEWDIKGALKRITEWENDSGRKVHIINISLGSVRKNDTELDNLLSQMSNEKVIVCAAANDGKLRSETIMYPGNHGKLLCIGSCDEDGNRDGFSAVGQALDFLFVGSDVVSYNSDWDSSGDMYIQEDGTSYAAPHCVALIARILAMIPHSDLRAKLTNCDDMKDFMKDLCGRTHKNDDGYGMPDFEKKTLYGRMVIYITEHRPDLLSLLTMSDLEELLR